MSADEKKASYILLNRDELPQGEGTFEFEGVQYANTEIAFIWVDKPPGVGVRLHEHPYPEIFIIQEGISTFTVGTETLVARAGQIIIAPANVPHKFVNSGEGQLKQIDIHLNKEFITRWLED